jgi:tRNA threonylcarbamoyladenosine biosynthesis protein TsaB
VILAVDTATRAMGLALAEAGRLVAEINWQTENNHTLELAPAVERLLAQAGLAPRDLTALAVAIGPGSFTGVRIGLGFAKGLALACDLPLLGVRTLDIVIRALPPEDGPALAVIQAGRGRVIWARYDFQAGRWAAASDGVVADWAAVAAAAASAGARVVGEVDEAGARALAAAGVALARPEQNRRRAAHLAQIGWEQWRAGAPAEAGAVRPIYAHAPTSGTA